MLSWTSVRHIMALSMLCLGCGEPVELTSSPLVDHSLWTVASPADDPFDDVEEPECLASSFSAEEVGGEPAFSVETARCNALTVVQSLRLDLVADEPIRLRFWHARLASRDGGTAHAAVRIGGSTIWEERFPIPSDSGLTDVTLHAPEALPAGTPIYFHLHNHGANSYSLIELSAGR
jgi:hypothetical protein